MVAIICSGEEAMYVCICHDVKDTQIKTALQQGINGIKGLQDSLSVGTCCGCCLPMVQDLIDEHQANFVAIDAMAS
ncbi:(2Fe-2S)-binding protein [Moraxella oculi]|uniref:Bacterioferritin-associated ferredoxin n=2 Tax=Moraxella oculi TaxID=2940516 RepID=A0ABW8U3Y8_9GAMM